MRGIPKKRAQEWVDGQYHDATLTAQVVQQVKETVGLAVAQGNPIDVDDCYKRTVREMDLSLDDLNGLWVHGVLLRGAANRVSGASEVAETAPRKEASRPIPEPLPISEQPVEEGSPLAVYRASTKEEQDAALLEMYQSMDINGREMLYRIAFYSLYRNSGEKVVA